MLVAFIIVSYNAYKLGFEEASETWPFKSEMSYFFV